MRSTTWWKVTRAREKQQMARRKSGLLGWADELVKDADAFGFSRLMKRPERLWRGTEALSLASFKKSRVEKVSVLGDLTLESVLLNHFPNPLDLKTFGLFCEQEYSQENLAFILSIDLFRMVDPKNMEYIDAVTAIRDNYLTPGAPWEVNIGFDLRNKQLVVIENALANEEMFGTMCFELAYREVKEMLRRDTFRRFKSAVALTGRVIEARYVALWCCFRDQTPTIKSFFTLPNPSNVVHYRLYRLIASILNTVALIDFGLNGGGKDIGVGHVCLLVNLGTLTLRTISGPRMDPMSFIVIFVLEPLVRYLRIWPTKFVTNKSRRWGEGMSALWTLGVLVSLYFQLEVLVYVLGITQTLTGFVHAFSDDK